MFAKADRSVLLTQRVHPFPFRTRKLSFAVPKILGWRRPGKIGHSRHIIKVAHWVQPLIYSSLAQSVEHMTVNHGVVGSSPTGGAKTRNHPIGWFFCFDSLLGSCQLLLILTATAYAVTATFAFWQSQKQTHNGVSLITLYYKAKRESNTEFNFRFTLSFILTILLWLFVIFYLHFLLFYTVFHSSTQQEPFL